MMPLALPVCAPRTIRCLRFQTIAPGRPYHAALSATEGTKARGFRITEHSHDFYEMIFVLAGSALHGINGNPTQLGAGDLILLRPGDWHYIRFETGRRLHYINIATDADLWRRFHTLVSDAALPAAPVVRSATERIAGTGAGEACQAAFQRALAAFQDKDAKPLTLRTEACLLLAILAPYLLGNAWQTGRSDAEALPNDAPPWLAGACKTLRHDPNALRLGLPAFVDCAGVTRTHLARVLKAATGQTPTEYINGLRLERAAGLLTTTTLSILDIADDCGFEQATYFYRLFRARFRTTPHAYRTAAARRVSP